LRLEYFARADALYTTSEASSFGKNPTSLGESQAVRQREYNRTRSVFIAKSGAAQWDVLYADIEKDARLTVGLTCGERMKDRTSQPRKCPNVPDGVKRFIPLAAAQLKAAEAFAASYSGSVRAVGDLAVAAASDRSRLWKATRPGMAASCETGDVVADFTGPGVQRSKNASGNDVLVASVCAFGNASEIAKVTVAPAARDYVLLG